MFSDIKCGDKVYSRNGVIYTVTNVDSNLGIFKTDRYTCHWMSDGKKNHALYSKNDIVGYYKRQIDTKNLMKNMFKEIKEKVDALEKMIDKL